MRFSPIRFRFGPAGGGTRTGKMAPAGSRTGAGTHTVVASALRPLPRSHATQSVPTPPSHCVSAGAQVSACEPASLHSGPLRGRLGFPSHRAVGVPTVPDVVGLLFLASCSGVGSRVWGWGPPFGWGRGTAMAKRSLLRLSPHRVGPVWHPRPSHQPQWPPRWVPSYRRSVQPDFRCFSWSILAQL